MLLKPFVPFVRIHPRPYAFERVVVGSVKVKVLP
jgi:hypothetical protein